VTADRQRRDREPFGLAARIVRPEHAVEMFRLLGGGAAGDIVGLPKPQLAVLPGTTHITVVDQADLLLSMIPAFLDAPLPKD
jgi:hypothetical protein